ncbi:MAG: hypothetical protein HY074_16555 [Deltaproteobacteria bacterium]|nr:hypothetical protein [Deltaproteobacteria bacterium]
MKTLSTPPFWDLHLHGVCGIDFMTATPDEMVVACENLGSHGTGAFAPTLLTAEPRLLRDACARWGAFLERCSNPKFLSTLAARPLGLHLEGPFLNPLMAGAHPKGALKKPNLALIHELLRAACGHVTIVTLAPEMPGALPLIRYLAQRNIRVQLGHTLADATQARAAVGAGATGVTHLFNAMRTHHRSPGLLAPLRRGQLTAEIITDGLHLDPEFVLWCCGAAPDSLYAVSDGCSAVGAKPGAHLTLGSLKLERRAKAAVVADSGILAGGATYLTAHPVVFGRLGVTPKNFLHLFYGIQQRLFPHVRTSARARNHFDPKTLRYLGSGAR